MKRRPGRPRKNQQRILIVNYDDQTYTLYKVLAEQHVPIAHAQVVPQVEAIHAYMGTIVLREGVQPAAAPPEVRQIIKPPPPAALNAVQGDMLARAYKTHQARRDGMPGSTVNTSTAQALTRKGLLEAFTPPGSYMTWYRITPAGINHYEGERKAAS